MSDRWIQDCKRILDHLKSLEKTEGQDRLDMVRAIRFSLHAFERSLSGWIEWVNNPDVMSSFSLEELKEISQNLSKLVHPFVEYDCEISSRTHEDLEITEPTRRRASKKENADVFYVS